MWFKETPRKLLICAAVCVKVFGRFVLDVINFRDCVDGFVETRLSGLSGILFEAL